MDNKYITKNEQETIRLGEDFAKKLKAQDTVFLIGDLGSGKTTFTKGVAKGLGVVTRVISPSFVVVRIHKVLENPKIQRMYHLDLYRLNSEKEVNGVDLKDFLNDKEGVVVIEWPTLSQNLVKKKVWKVNFEADNNENRKITISYE